jgi:hypothetical protein
MIYFIDSGAVTVTSANTTAGAVGTIKLINGFYNPTASGVNAIIYQAVIATVSGTPAGPLYWNFLQEVATSTATGTIQQALLKNTAGNSLMVAQTGVVIAGAGTPSFIQAGVIGGNSAVAAGAGVSSYTVDYRPPLTGSNGSYFIIVPPGTVFGIAATGAGTSHVVQTTMYWEEVPA